MKNLSIFFWGCLLLSSPHLANSQVFGKSPEEKCFDAQMKVWNTIPNQPLFVYRTGSSEKKGYGKIINDKKYLTMLEGNLINLAKPSTKQKPGWEVYEEMKKLFVYLLVLSQAKVSGELVEVDNIAGVYEDKSVNPNKLSQCLAPDMYSEIVFLLESDDYENKIEYISMFSCEFLSKARRKRQV